MRVKNTEPDRKPLNHLYVEGIMGDHYDPPGIEFFESGTSQEVVKEVGEALARSEAYPNIVRASEAQTAADDDDESSDDAAETDDGTASPDSDAGGDGTDSDAGGDTDDNDE